MFVLPLILAAGSLSTFSYGAPVPSFLSSAVTKVTSSLSLKERSSYTVFGGTGDLTDGWPSSSSWASLDTMFTNNMQNIKGSCTQWNVANPTDDEISNMKSAISSVASSTGVDARFIFAIMMQESNGCPRAPTTNYGVRNPGLMQSHDGSGTCNEGSVQNPCPSSAITQMIQDGAGGTSGGDGLKQCIAQSGASDDSKYYKAARIYNSGSIASTKNLGAGIATHCYASDIANRLMGWTGAGSSCDQNTIGTLSGTVTSPGSGSGGSGSGSGGSGASSAPPAPAPTSSSTSVYIPPSAPSSSSTTAPKPTTSPTKPASPPASTGAGGVFAQTSAPAPSPSPPAPTTSSTVAPVATAAPAPPAPSPQPLAGSSSTPVSTTAEKYPYANGACKSWYTVQPNDYCILVEKKFGISMAQLQSWNGGLDTQCSNLWLGYQYCVGA